MNISLSAFSELILRVLLHLLQFDIALTFQYHFMNIFYLITKDSNVKSFNYIKIFKQIFFFLFGHLFWPHLEACRVLAP